MLVLAAGSLSACGCEAPVSMTSEGIVEEESKAVEESKGAEESRAALSAKVEML